MRLLSRIAFTLPTWRWIGWGLVWVGLIAVLTAGWHTCLWLLIPGTLSSLLGALVVVSVEIHNVLTSKAPPTRSTP